MRAALALVLCLSTAVAQGRKRTAADVLADYAKVLGDVSHVRALHATGSLSTPQGTQRMSVYFKDGKCFRTTPGRAVRSEYVSDDGVFISHVGLFERYRPELESDRGMYYAQRMIADPFPLLPFLKNAAAAAGLRPGAADLKNGQAFEVLGTAPDSRGIHIQYLLDRRTHVLSIVQFKQGRLTIAALRFEAHKRVQGVLLPGAVRMFARFLVEEEGNRTRLVVKGSQRVEQYLKWTVNPDLKGVSFEVPGVSPKATKGFRRVELDTGPEPAELAVGDVDGDGKPDIAVACHGGLWVHFGGALQKPVKVALGKWRHRGVVIEDMDRDGRLEILTMSRLLPAETLFVVTFDKQRKPQVVKHLGAPFLGYALACADLDLDGLGDVVSSGRRVLDIKFGNGQRGFRVRGLRPTLTNKQNKRPRGYGVAIGRLDRDHLKDIVVADGTRLRVFTARPNGTFSPEPPMPAGRRPVDVCLADVNEDGRLDLLVANDNLFGDLQGDIAVLLNTGGGGLKFRAKFEAGVRTPAVRAGHFNADGHVDAVAASYLTGEVRVLLGDGTGGFKPGVRLHSGRGTHRLHIADFDGDGADDILASNRLDDTVTILLNRTGAAARPRMPAPRARECRRTEVPFQLQGLTARYEFAGEFRIPADIRDPSGIAFLGGDDAHRQLVLVSDKEPSLFRVALDTRNKRLLVGPRVPLIGAAGRLDLEGAAYDGSGNLFLACESDSSILRVTLLGHVLDRVGTGIEAGKNDGIEGLALRRKKDGTPLLYVFKERMGMTGKQPPVQVHGMQEDPFALPLALKTKLPVPSPDQTGATVAGDRMFVVSRLGRAIFELAFDGRGFAAKPKKTASFARLTEDLLGLNSTFGVVEGIAIDHWGDLYLLIDNNGKVTGKKGLNRGNEGRLLWFRTLNPPVAPVVPREVVVKHIYIPWQGALGDPQVRLTRQQAADLSEEVGRKLRAGADFDEMATKHHYRQSRFPLLLKIKVPPAKFKPDEFNRDKLPASFSRLAFALALNEVGVAEFHRKESPYGFHILIRIR